MDKRILIIEDEEDLSLMLKMYLEAKGYAVEEARNGVKGLKRIEEQLPDLVLLDLVMPVMDGWEVCRQLRRDKKTRELPIIFLTALSSRNLDKEAEAMGASGLITKPCDEPELLEVIASHL